MNTAYHRRPGLTRHTSGPAFTLIELLVVVSIIALLVAILLPSLARAREQTKALKCLANARSIANGVLLYVQDHYVLPGPLHAPIYRLTGDPDSPFGAMNEAMEKPWFLLHRLGPYLSKSDNFLKFVDEVSECPTAVGKFKDSHFLPPSKGGNENNPEWSRPFNYLPNTWANTRPDYYFGWTHTGYDWEGVTKPSNPSFHPPKPLERIKRASDEWMLGDAWWKLTVIRPKPTQTIRTLVGTWQMDMPAEHQSQYPLPRAPYHGSGSDNARSTNLIYFDGHGGPFKGMESWALKFPANPKQE
ncbi:MAG: type II secretion system protein [Sedimentisphaerales bacterium]|nr:type II secretion system protein [Sedimentisphaerales bacterium]